MKPVADTLHLIKRGDVYVYFRRVPRHLVPVIGRQFIKRSLGVTSRAEAKQLRSIEDVRVDALFASAEKGAADASQPVSMAMLTEHVRETVERLDKRSAKRLAENPPADREELQERRERTEIDIDRLRDAFDPDAASGAQATAREIATERGIDVERPDFPFFEFVEIVKRGLIEAGQRRLDRLDGHHDRPFHDPLFDAKRAPTAISFGDLAKTFMSETTQDHAANKISAKRTEKVEAALGTLREIVGDKIAVHTIDDDVVQRVRQTIAETPANRLKLYPKLSLTKAVEKAKKDGKPTLSPITQAIYLAVFRDVLKVAVRKKLLPSNPAADIKPIVRDAMSNAQRREPWTPEQLKGFFTGAFYRSCQPGAANPYAKPDRAWRFWLPLVLLHTGARPNEVCGLTVDDVRQTQAGTWFLNVDDEGDGKSLKTKASKRRVPLHPELIKFGFLTFVEERRKAKAGSRLFPDLKPNRHGNFAWYALRRLNEHFIPRDVTLGDRQSLYSLRHNVRDALRRAKAGPETLLAIAGWSPAGKAVSDDYGDPGNPDLHAEAVAAINYPGLDLSFLHVA